MRRETHRRTPLRKKVGVKTPTDEGGMKRLAPNIVEEVLEMTKDRTIVLLRPVKDGRYRVMGAGNE